MRDKERRELRGLETSAPKSLRDFIQRKFCDIAAEVMAQPEPQGQVKPCECWRERLRELKRGRDWDNRVRALRL
jgi:hypothetical protein